MMLMMFGIINKVITRWKGGRDKGEVEEEEEERRRRRKAREGTNEELEEDFDRREERIVKERKESKARWTSD